MKTAREKLRAAIDIVAIGLILLFICGFFYVAGHFIIKYW